MPSAIRRILESYPELRRIVDNVGWLFADRGVRMIVGLVVSVWMARYLGPEGFGIINYALALTSICGVFALLGLNNVVVREIVQKPDEAGTIVGTAATLMLGGAVLGYAVLVVAVRLVQPDNTTIQIATVIIGASILFRAAEAGAYWFEAQVRSKYVIWATGGVFLLAAAAKILLILLGLPLTAFAAVILIQAILTAISIGLVSAYAGMRPARLQFDSKRALQLFSSSWPLLLSSIAVVIYMKIDQVMIAAMLDEEAVGIYSASVSVSEATYVAAVIIAASVFPAILAAKDRDPGLYRRRFQRLFDVVTLIAFAIAIPVSFAGTWLMTLLFGEPYRASGPLLTVHIWASIFVFLGVVSNRWFVAEHRQLLNLQRTLLGAVINVALNFVLIPRWGLMGAAVATIVAHAVASFASDLVQAETRHLFRMKLASLFIPSAIRRVLRHA